MVDRFENNKKERVLLKANIKKLYFQYINNKIKEYEY